MRFLIFLVAWCILLVLSWPLALLVLAAAPLVWLIALAFRLIALCIHALFALLHAVVLVPVRLLGYRSRAA